MGQHICVFLGHGKGVHLVYGVLELLPLHFNKKSLCCGAVYLNSGSFVDMLQRRMWMSESQMKKKMS